MSKKAFDNFISRYPIVLNAQQREAAQAVEGCTLLLAVPGSGKTTVLIARLGYMLLELGIRPESVLTVTFTKAAAQDMRLRYRRFFGENIPEGLRMGTINSFCFYIVKAAEELGFPHYETAGDGQSLRILDDVLRRVNGLDITKNSDNELRGAAQEITLAKNMMTPADEVTSEKVENFREVYREYNRALHGSALMDFDDQLVFAYKILIKFPEILERIRRRYKYICVDEAQDTSKIQHEIIKLIAGNGGNLFMVGDEDQCIYAFRGGYPDALMDFRREHPAAGVLKIEYNYRSNAGITAAAQKFIEQNRSRDASKKIHATRKGKHGLTELRVRDEYQQLMEIIKAAQHCTVQTAVLYRNNDSAIPMIDRLCANGIAFKCRELSTMFFSSPTVRDIRDIIEFSKKPDSGRLFMALYYKLGAYLRREEAEKIVRECPRGGGLLGYAEKLDSLTEFKRARCAEIRAAMRRLELNNAHDAMQIILEELGYRAYAESKELNPEHLRVLLLVSRSQPSPEALTQRLDELEKIIRDDPSAPDCEFTLSTIHSSKGLEYKRVYLADVIDGCLPMANAKIEEERRLFYVGMTRAEDELFIFTFTKDKLRSQFSEFLFPKEAGTAQTKRTLLPPGERTVKLGKLKLGVGENIEHTIFGTGKIEKLSGDVMTVYFSKFGYKAVSISVCEKNGWLKKPR